MNPLTVLQVPVGDANPYQTLLIQHLAAEGAIVRRGKAAGLLPLARLVLRGGLPDVLHLHWIQPFVISRTSFAVSLVKAPLAMLQLLLLRLAGVRIVWTVHELHHHENPHPRWDAFFNQLTARIAHEAITHCQVAAEEIRSTLSPTLPVTVLAHPNYDPAYGRAPAKAECRRVLGVPEDRLLILHLGLIRPYKGTLELIEAFAGFADRATLLVAGEIPDPAYAAAVRRAADRHGVTLVEHYVPVEQIPVYLGAADIMAIPFRAVVNSGSAVLGMTFGLPIIASRVGCIPEVVGDEGGFLYDAHDAGGLRSAIGRAIESAATLADIGRRNRREAERHDWPTSARKTMDVYRAALAR